MQKEYIYYNQFHINKKDKKDKIDKILIENPFFFL